MRENHRLTLLHQYLPAILCLALMVLHFTSAYPGGMTPDTFDQYTQSLSGKYYSQHPPLMSMLWSCFHFIYQGPETMLLLQLLFLWAGVLLLFYADCQNKVRFLYLLIPFLPNILAESGIIWKDVGFAFSSFFVTAVCIFYTYKQSKMKLPIAVGLIIICFYLVGVKFQAQFIAPILILYILSLYLKVSLPVRIITCTIISSLIILINNFIISNFTIDTHFKQCRQLWDIAGISVRANDDSLFPHYVRQSPLYDFEKVQKNYTPQLVNALIFPEDKIYIMTQDPKQLQAMDRAHINAILRHPIYYLKHRIENFTYLMQSTAHNPYYGFITEKLEAKKLGIDVEGSNLKQLTVKYLNLFPKSLVKNWTSFILTIIYSIYLLKNRSSKKTEHIILRYTTSICLVFTCVMFFITLAADHRYYYIVRVLSLFSLPIFLKAMFEDSRWFKVMK